MPIFYLLLFIYLVIFVIVIILLSTRKNRNYWRRVFIDLKPCPFGKETYSILSSQGENFNSFGTISYSLYGNYDKYTSNLYKSLENIPKLLPNWQARVYVANNIPSEVRQEILKRGAELIVMGPELPKGHEAALWRFLPAKEAKPFVSLDADDVFNSRVANGINKWIASGKRFCSLNPFNFYLPMTAGTWGSRDAAIPHIQELIDKYCEHWFGFDESFLYTHIWPITEKYGYWKSSNLPLKTLTALGIIALIILIVCSLYMAYLAQFSK